jgi:thiol-disulfide isomerase/thioredoxin
MSGATHPQFVRRLFFKCGCVAAAGLLTIITISPADAGPIAWHKDLQAAMRESARQQKPVLVSVGARWCGPCRRMHSETFPNAAFAAQVNSQFIPVLLDADEQAAVVQKLGVDSFPTVLVISPENKIVGRFTGFQTAPQLQSRLAAFRPRVVTQRPLLADLTPRPPAFPAPAAQLRATPGAPEAPYPQPPESDLREVQLAAAEPRPQPPETETFAVHVPFHQRAWAAIQAAHPQTTLKAAEEFSMSRK